MFIFALSECLLTGAGVRDNYETGVDCGGDCKPCNLLAFSALLAVGNYSSVLANSSAAYITYDHFLSFNESVCFQHLVM